MGGVGPSGTEVAIFNFAAFAGALGCAILLGGDKRGFVLQFLQRIVLLIGGAIVGLAATFALLLLSGISRL